MSGTPHRWKHSPEPATAFDFANSKLHVDTQASPAAIQHPFGIRAVCANPMWSPTGFRQTRPALYEPLFPFVKEGHSGLRHAGRATDEYLQMFLKEHGGEPPASGSQSHQFGSDCPGDDDGRSIGSSTHTFQEYFESEQFRRSCLSRMDDAWAANVRLLSKWRPLLQSSCSPSPRKQQDLLGTSSAWSSASSQEGERNDPKIRHQSVRNAPLKAASALPGKWYTSMSDPGFRADDRHAAKTGDQDSMRSSDSVQLGIQGPLTSGASYQEVDRLDSGEQEPKTSSLGNVTIGRHDVPPSDASSQEGDRCSSNVSARDSDQIPRNKESSQSVKKHRVPKLVLPPPPDSQVDLRRETSPKTEDIAPVVPVDSKVLESQTTDAHIVADSDLCDITSERTLTTEEAELRSFLTKEEAHGEQHTRVPIGEEAHKLAEGPLESELEVRLEALEKYVGDLQSAKTQTRQELLETSNDMWKMESELRNCEAEYSQVKHEEANLASRLSFGQRAKSKIKGRLVNATGSLIAEAEEARERERHAVEHSAAADARAASAHRMNSQLRQRMQNMEVEHREEFDEHAAANHSQRLKVLDYEMKVKSEMASFEGDVVKYEEAEVDVEHEMAQVRALFPEEVHAYFMDEEAELNASNEEMYEEAQVANARANELEKKLRASAQQLAPLRAQNDALRSELRSAEEQRQALKEEASKYEKKEKMSGKSFAMLRAQGDGTKQALEKAKQEMLAVSASLDASRDALRQEEAKVELERKSWKKEASEHDKKERMLSTNLAKLRADASYFEVSRDALRQEKAKIEVERNAWQEEANMYEKKERVLSTSLAQLRATASNHAQILKENELLKEMLADRGISYKSTLRRSRMHSSPRSSITKAPSLRSSMDSTGIDMVGFCTEAPKQASSRVSFAEQNDGFLDSEAGDVSTPVCYDSEAVDINTPLWSGARSASSDFSVPANIVQSPVSMHVVEPKVEHVVSNDLATMKSHALNAAEEAASFQENLLKLASASEDGSGITLSSRRSPRDERGSASKGTASKGTRGSARKGTTKPHIQQEMPKMVAINSVASEEESW